MSKVFLVLTFTHNIGMKNKLYGYFKHHKYVQKIYYLCHRGNFLAMKYRQQIVSQKINSIDNKLFGLEQISYPNSISQ